MPNALSYCLFGYNKQNKDSFDFNTYFRYMGLNMRMAELLYPDWKFHVVMDEETFESPYKSFFEYHREQGNLRVKIVPLQPLTLMMLNRLQPAFPGDYGYDRFVCRDLDSLLTYRERQAVKYWENTGRVAHAITDSFSHGIALMGGMVGFLSQQFRERMGAGTMDELVAKVSGYKWHVKGTDQNFLNNYVYRRVSDSITQHYILGMPQTFMGDCYNFIQDVEIENVDVALKESNHLINHIGQSGCAIEPVLKFFEQFESKESIQYFEEAEKMYKKVFYWHL